MNIEKQYLKLLKDIMKNGVKKEDRTGTGTISVFGRQIRHKMSEGFPLLTTKKMYWKGIVTELLWFLRGDTNIKYLVDNDCHIWDGDCFANYYRNFEKYLNTLPAGSKVEFIINKDKFINRIKTDTEFAKKWGDLGPVYGAQWRKWDGIDQIQELINTLKTNPESRRMLVSAWNVNYLDEMVLPPCHYGFQVYTRETNGKRYISLMWNQRSVDTPLGLPFNIASYALLLRIIAKEVNMIPDELIGNLGDCHIYQNQIDGVYEQLNREIGTCPELVINDEFWNPDASLIEQLDYIEITDFDIRNYHPQPTIKFPLSN